MRFGGLVGDRRSLLHRRPRRHHRADRPERRRQDHRLQLHHRLLQADRGPHRHARSSRGVVADASTRLTASSGQGDRSTAQLFLLERMPDHEIAQYAPGRAHLPEHPPVRRHDAAREPARRPAQPADGAPRLTRSAASSACRAIARASSDGDREGALLAGADRPDRPRRRPGRRPALRRAAAAGDRPRHVHRAACCSASTSRPPASTRARSAELNELLRFIRARARRSRSSSSSTTWAW